MRLVGRFWNGAQAIECQGRREDYRFQRETGDAKTALDGVGARCEGEPAACSRAEASRASEVEAATAPLLIAIAARGGADTREPLRSMPGCREYRVTNRAGTVDAVGFVNQRDAIAEDLQESPEAFGTLDFDIRLSRNTMYIA
jgi:hypothetical protein